MVSVKIVSKKEIDMDTVILILLSLAVVLLIMIAAKLFSAKKESSAVTDEKIDNLRTLTQENFSALRSENVNADNALRTLLSSSLENVSGKMDILSEKTSDGRLGFFKAQILRARYVPVSVGRGTSRRSPRGIYRNRYSFQNEENAGL